MRVVMAAMRLARKRESSRARGAVGGGCALAAVGLLLAACGPISAGSSVGTTPVSGGTATYATLPGFNANYIFPFTDSSYFTTTNTNDFQYLMYRPLYWFGDGVKPYLNKQLSIAYPPVYHGQTVTIALKHYMWSNGQPVTAHDVMFFINMLRELDSPALAAQGKAVWAGYIPGYFPDNVTDIHTVGADKIVMRIIGPYSEDWFTDNELSQITPMPKAWDVTAPGKATDCEHVPADCAAVYSYLNKNAVSPQDWRSFGLWDIVDGPFKLVSATSTDNVSMTYNSSYSGPHAAHHVQNFDLVPFISEQAEYNVLEDPQGGQKIDVGYLPTVDAPAPPAGSQVGANPASLSGYKLSVIYPWELSYFPYNFNDPHAGPIFKQLYFRKAFQLLVDQEGVINGPMHGYGKVIIGPVTAYPATNYLSRALAKSGDQWTLNPTEAEQLLHNHGWQFSAAAGADTCRSPGSGPANCGAGIARGTPLSFTLMYTDAQDFITSQAKELASNASQAGIHVTLSAQPVSTILGDVFARAGSWQLAEWGSWTYAPDYLPTGEELFQTNSVANGGGYSDRTNDADIRATLRARTSTQFDAAMYKWEGYLAGQFPVVYVPNAATLVEAVDNLVIGRQDPTLTINPEDWYYLQ